MDVFAWRRETRARLIAQRLSIPGEEHLRLSLKIEQLVEEVLLDLPPQTVSAYWPFQAEVDLRGLIERLRVKGWTAALPFVVKKGSPLEFHRWVADAEMDQGVYGIPVPRIRVPVQPDVSILPLVGFDAQNFRLGYGAGYYDITLAALQPRPRTIGVGFELSRLETIHPHPSDIPLDLIITEAGIQQFGDAHQIG
jgi:5,10-methenyltetrahydrofolate synthetase